MTQTLMTRRTAIRGLLAAVAAPALAACSTSNARIAPGHPGALGALPFNTPASGACPIGNDPNMTAVDLQACKQAPGMFTRLANIPRPYEVGYFGDQPTGTIIVNNASFSLYYIQQPQRSEDSPGWALHYSVAIGREGIEIRPNSEFRIARRTQWPTYTPVKTLITQPGGVTNPMGARALYLYQGGKDTYYRIHGTTEPWKIGTNASAGCIRMFNPDVMDLYNRAADGAKVIVLNDPSFEPRRIARVQSSTLTL